MQIYAYIWWEYATYIQYTHMQIVSVCVYVFVSSLSNLQGIC